jgi:hypothetical protein
MRITFEGRWLRFELELGTPCPPPRKYEVLPRRTCFRVREAIWRGVASRLHEKKKEVPRHFQWMKGERNFRFTGWRLKIRFINYWD